MAIIGSNSTAAQMYGGVQKTNAGSPVSGIKAPLNRSAETGNEFRMPSNATPRGDWVLSENADPQSFDAGAPRGSYLNVLA